MCKLSALGRQAQGERFPNMGMERAFGGLIAVAITLTKRRERPNVWAYGNGLEQTVTVKRPDLKTVHQVRRHGPKSFPLLSHGIWRGVGTLNCPTAIHVTAPWNSPTLTVKVGPLPRRNRWGPKVHIHEPKASMGLAACGKAQPSD
ncbi:MAG: hypothetical protein ACOH5I_26715 [Oligoflexus sp.]